MARRKPPPAPLAQGDLFPESAPPAATNEEWARIEAEARRGSESLENRRKLVKPKYKNQLALFDGEP